ncbi:MAG TPA: flagellar assembly protein T N-terminal domain-containing protein [Spirochaetota bacterium]|nr:flagellar assembly protein T N-terminal domain-containing protein [Spirochaetota bacterium]
MKKIAYLLIPLLVIIGCETTGGAKSGVQLNQNYTGKGGETKPVVVEGKAQILTDGEQAAFERALKHAMRKAVEKVLGAMVKSKTLVENSKLIEDKIYKKSSGFVQKYNVLDDSRQQDTKLVTIKAWVVLGDVEDDAMALGLLQDNVNRPHAMVLVKENRISDNKPTDYAKNVIHQLFADKQFQFVDEEQIKKVLANRNFKLAKLTKMSESELAKLAVDAGAQILIKGTVQSSKQNIKNNPMIPDNWKSVRTTLNIDVLYAADATIIASGSATKPAAMLDVNSAQGKSIKQAAQEVCPQLITKVIKKWDNMVNNGFEYDVIISGINFNDARIIQKSFSQNIEGVKKVFNKGFNNSILTLRIRFTGTPFELAGMLVEPGKCPVKLSMQKYDSKAIMLSKK